MTQFNELPAPTRHRGTREGSYNDMNRRLQGDDGAATIWMILGTVVILAARDLNENIRVFARARYLKERAWLEEVGANAVVTEEGETAIGLAAMLLKEVGADEDRVREEIRKIHDELRAPQETRESS